MHNITLQHGDGGLHTAQLIKDVFHRHFANELLNGYQDAAIFTLEHERLAFTTDTFVVNPIFFAGGDIGKLAVCGTVNDLAAAGALPRCKNLLALQNIAENHHYFLFNMCAPCYRKIHKFVL